MKILLRQFNRPLVPLLLGCVLLTGCITGGTTSKGPKISKAKPVASEAQAASSAETVEVTPAPKKQAQIQRLQPGFQVPEIEIGPKIQQQFNTALDFMAGSRFADAERILLQLTQSNPNLSGPYVNLGIVYLNQGLVEKAESMLQQAISVNPGNAPAHNHYGILLRTQGRFEDARSSYQNALTANPQYANAHLNLGVLYDLYLQDPQSAIVHYEQFQEMSNGEDKMVKIWIADLTRRYGDKRAAQRGSHD